MKDTQYLDGFIGELLHINEVADNKLIDLGAGNGAGTYILSHTCIDLASYAVKTAAERMGKTATTILLDSAKAGGEQRVNRRLNTYGWKSYRGDRDVAALHAFIETARKELVLRGNNPLFLSVGALKWRVFVRERGKDVLKDVETPFIVYPVRLIVSSNAAPVAIEFIEDDVYINPCLIAKLEQVYGEEIAAGLPKIGGRENNQPIDLQALGDGTEYFAAVKAYIDGCNQGGDNDTRFEFDKDEVAIAQYKHGELCTYYDIRRNKDKIYSHPLVKRVFEKSHARRESDGETRLPAYVLPRDSVQEKIITRIVNGESMIIKGPPGTGKTVTIANAIAALMNENKRVLFASKKISALTEVYAKLPEKLRKFAMLLDCETEKNAAKISPEEIKTDFKRLIADVKEYREPAQLSADVNHASAERAKAMRSLSAYVDIMHNDRCIAEGDFYSALDAVCKTDMPVIEFADGDSIKNVGRSQYNFLLSQTEEAESAFNVLTAGGAHPAYLCPWFGLDSSCDTEGAMRLAEAAGKRAEKVFGTVTAILAGTGLEADNFTLGQILGAAACTLSEESVRAIMSAEDFNAAEMAERLQAAVDEFTALPEGKLIWKEKPSDEAIVRGAAYFAAMKADDGLTFGQMELIAGEEDILKIGGEYISGDSVKSLNKLFGEIDGKLSEAKRNLLLADEVFKSDLSGEETALIKESVQALSEYAASGAEKPKPLDFKAKKLYKKLCGLSYLSAPSFKDISGAIGKYAAAFALMAEKDALLEGVYKILHAKLTPEQTECVKTVADRCNLKSQTVGAFVAEIRGLYGSIRGYHEFIDDEKKQATVPEIKLLYERELRFKVLKELLLSFAEVAPACAAEEGKEVDSARNISGAITFIAACLKLGADNERAIGALKKLGGNTELKRETESLLGEFTEFGKKYFRNFYAMNGGNCTFGETRVLSDEADDRKALAAAAKYTAIKHDPRNALDLSDFLYWFEKGGMLSEGVHFKDAFEHSFFSLAIRARNAELGIFRNGLGASADRNLEKLRAADEKLCALNSSVIESKCLSRIKPDDEDFIFVQDRNPNENLRLMFRRHASGILKLKNCMILSPYTASLLFRGEEYEDFDVLIVDEASQMEPALLLPVLFRSKQCVIVGDEWQMPPIKHFAVLSPVQDDGGEDSYEALEPEISVLGLALRNEGFPVEELVCHYRSRTETLIKFSQESFYPNMRTFPSPVPARAPAQGVTGLGFKDVYVPDGVVCAGRNIKEAEKVVEALNAHFENYYDEKTHILSQSVGVVAFGEAQLSAIEERVKADRNLSAKIRDALEKFDDLPEKLIFFKTIETVQGQETGHLILSITHGRRQGGLYMHFGQLNQGKLGRCVFNVAVTRAQNFVTVIHSVRGSEVTGSVAYIGEYLQTVERFAEEGRGQFVSEEAERGFIGSVVQFIRGLGISAERIAVDYGVTEGSVRMPIAVLDKNLKHAVLGIWCEKPTGGKYDFLDYEMRYKQTLSGCGWKIHTVRIHEWVDDNKNEREALCKVLEDILKEEEKD